MLDQNELEVQMQRIEGAPARARRELRAFCADRVESDLISDAELIVSELVTNAVRHGEGAVGLRARIDDDRLFVEVVDEGSGFERTLRGAEFEQVGGRGLEIVDETACRWGVHEGTTHVWFELELPGPRLGEPAS